MVAVPAVAAEFELGAFEGSFNSQISLGASWRMSEREPLLVTPGNAPGFGTASTGTADDGDLNYGDGDIYSLILKGVHDLELRNGDFGVFLRGKYWYDQELENGKVPHGNSANQYTANVKLDTSGFDDFAQGSGIELLDAFIYNTFYLGENEAPLDVRLGRQVISWGESTFIQNGINTVNPIDVSAFRRPGAEIKEGLLPVSMLTISAGVTNALSIDLFYQLEWEKTVIDGCGTYFSTADVAATGCNVVTLRGGLSDAANMASGLFISRVTDVEPDDDGQYGIAFRYFAEKLAGSEFGLYYMNYHSRTPYLGGFSQTNTLVPTAAIPPELIAGLTPLIGSPPWTFVPGNRFAGLQLSPTLTITGNAKYFAEFPEDIELFGMSFATNLAGFAVSGEVSYRPDFPVQINTTEILQGAVSEAPYSTVLPRIRAVDPGGVASGYDLLPVTQAQVTFIRFFDQVMGASRLSFAAEIGANWVGSLPEQTVQRYGRSPTYGMGTFTPIPLTALFGIDPAALPFLPGDLPEELAGNLACDQPFIPSQDFLDFVAPRVVVPIVPNTNSRNCTNDGYVTDSSWGYRIRAGLTYNDAFAGINLTPSLAWSHDVDGYSPNSNFNEGAKALTVSLAGEYLNRYTGSLAYTAFSGGDYNTVEDRDFLSFSVAVSF
ncbi:MAG: DUF1302 domain-containing protein [Gammaproteobacteria bacterium]|nr:DUF1302 domain-containing protein [Gammaproteobacteria bacterium]NNL43917.1 DUF1302 domain-containing protein [Woeseiaceae bacterium]